MADTSGEFGLSTYLWYNRRIIKSRTKRTQSNNNQPKVLTVVKQYQGA
jgi:hypothetical protein